MPEDVMNSCRCVTQYRTQFYLALVMTGDSRAFKLHPFLSPSLPPSIPFPSAQALIPTTILVTNFFMDFYYSFNEHF